MTTKQCSDCKCVLLQEEYFSKKRDGNWYKTCNGCRKKFECDQCDYKCSTNGNLQKHIKSVHDKIKDYACDKCKFKSSTNVDLQKHIKNVHNKAKDFGCDQCDAKFSTNGNLQRHIKAVHDKIKDFGCDQCDFKCLEDSTLQHHIRSVHDKLKPHGCDNCNYKFSTNGHLQRHIKTCTGESTLSSGEFKLQKILIEMKVQFTKGSYKLKNPKTNYLLQWDIIIQGLDKPLFVEYDGKQHFIQKSGREPLEVIQYRDELKNNFCKENGYKLLRIPYTEYENMEKLVVDFLRTHADWGVE